MQRIKFNFVHTGRLNSLRMCSLLGKQHNNHLCIVKHAQIRVHAQGFGFMAAVFVKLCCFVEFPLVGHDVGQKQLVFVLTVLLPLLKINQHKDQHIWIDKYLCAQIKYVHTHTRIE